MIEVKHLTKKYGERTAVSDISFSIEKGKIYGLLGPNGAGKSTTMNIITGCLAATEGEIRINGCDIYEKAEAAKKMIGYLPEQPPLYQDMTPMEYLHFVARAKGVKKEDESSQLKNILTLTQIEHVKDRLIKNLSKGYKQRVGIAQALVGDPDIIILDEPTVGLDPKQIIEIRDLIKTLGQGHTVILSSHILSEVRAVCDSVMIISNGKLVASDTPENLEKLFAGSSTVSLTVIADEETVRGALKGIDGITDISYKISADGTAQVLVTCEGQKDVRESIFFAFCEVKRPILQMTTAHMSLEDIFIELTSGNEPETMTQNKNAPNGPDGQNTEDGQVSIEKTALKETQDGGETV